MNPVAIFRHSPTEGTGHFATYLDAHRIPWRLVRIDEGEAVPATTSGFSGLCFMGGPMSVNDDLPWIPAVLSLIRRAVDAGVPVVGHCLGGQLMSSALGGVVTRNPVKEIGWGAVRAAPNEVASAWLGGIDAFEAFHWHGETFSLPPGATLIASSDHCAHQAFVFGKHLGMQCHVEMTADLIRSWCADWGGELLSRAGPSVQTPEQMLAGLDARVAALQAVAERIYGRWIAGLDKK